MTGISSELIQNLPWVKNWFDTAYYHSLYQQNDEKEAAMFINKIVAELECAPGSCMIDIGCGSGRHCKQLYSKGFDVKGIDLSRMSIRRAKKYEREGLKFYIHDMRNGFGRNRFDYAFNLFTSFGYFENKADNSLVIQNISNALKPGGRLVLDYLNVPYTERKLVRKEMKEIDGVTYSISRWMDRQHFFKRIDIEENNDTDTYSFTEQVAKLYLDDFEQLFKQNGLYIEKVFGDYRMNTYHKNNSPRLIMVVQKRHH